MKGDRVIGKLLHPSGRVYTVFWWHNYGMVAPTLITTNGSVVATCGYIRDMVARGYIWEGPELDPEAITAHHRALDIQEASE